MSRLRTTQPLVEIRIPFEMSREELDAIDRGAQDADLDAVRNAARAAAIAEDRAIFQGYPAAHIEGIFAASAASGASRFRRTSRRIPTSSPRRRIACAAKASAVRTASHSGRGVTPG